jgi:hypothetical protein
MQPGIIGNGRAVAPKTIGTRLQAPLAVRFLDKLVLDILPAALASVIGGFLFAQYHAGHAARLATEQVTPASAEMMAMVRDEHSMMMDYLKSQIAAEKNRAASEDAATARAVADAKAAADGNAENQAADVPSIQEAAVRQAAPRVKKPAVVAAVPHAPLVIAQADQAPDQSADAAPQNRLASDPDSLLAKTLDLKDQFVAAAGHVVSAIGNVFTTVGEHVGGNGVRQFNS